MVALTSFRRLCRREKVLIWHLGRDVSGDFRRGLLRVAQIIILRRLRFTHPTHFRSLPRDSLTLIPRGTVVPFKACFDSSRVVVLVSSSFFFFRVFYLRWLRPQAAMPPSKSPYLAPWSERSGDKVRVAQNSKFLARFRSAGSLFPTPFLRVAPLRWLRPGGSAAEKQVLI